MGEDINRPLLRLAEAFDDLVARMTSQTQDLDLRIFSNGCSLISPIFQVLGIAFNFMQSEYSDKVDDLIEASESIPSLQSMIELDIQNNHVRYGHSKNLLRVNRGLDVTRLLFDNLLSEMRQSPTKAAIDAYERVFSAHHGEILRNLVKAALHTMPRRSKLLKKLNEDDASARVLMQRYVSSSHLVIRYVEEIFLSRNLGIDWVVTGAGNTCTRSVKACLILDGGVRVRHSTRSDTGISGDSTSYSCRYFGGLVMRVLRRRGCSAIACGSVFSQVRPCSTLGAMVSTSGATYCVSWASGTWSGLMAAGAVEVGHLIQ